LHKSYHKFYGSLKEVREYEVINLTIELSTNFQNEIKKLNTKDINYRYELENKMMSAIRRGNYEEYLKIVSKDGMPEDFDLRVTSVPEDLLRDRKHGLETRKTLMRIAAKDGGVPPVYLHIISLKFATLIDQATSADYLDNVLADEMAKVYCDAVKEHSVKNYSSAIKSAILYIDSHLTEEINVQEVAEALHFHPSYLSRKFKEETGRNLTDYVNGHRVEYAKTLFRTEKTDVTNVALSCGYNSSSYFSRVFKKYTGISPIEFIEQVTND
jgi:AraC-like DNA-binding protein